MKQRKDVLVLCQYFYPENITSALLPFMVAKHLVKEGVSVDVFTGIPSNYLKKDYTVPLRETAEGVNIRRLNYLTLSKKGFLGRLANYFSIVLSFLLKIFEMRHYKVLIVYSNPPILPLVAVLAKLIFKNKIVFVSFDVYPEIAIETNVITENSLIASSMRLVNRCLFKHVDKVVALSEEMKHYLTNNRKIDPERVDVIYNWSTETERIELTEKQSTEHFTIGYFGNIGIAQDFETIKKLILDQKKNSTLKWVFAGHGVYYSEFERFLSEHKIENVKLLGYLDEEELKRVATDCDAFLLSLKDELHGLAVPSKYYTYLHYRKPIIAIISENSDIAKDIERLNLGVAYSNRQYPQLLDAIQSLAKGNVPHIDERQWSAALDTNLQLSKYKKLVEELL